MATDPMWISSVTIGVPAPQRAVRFYERLLGWTVTADEGPAEGEPADAGWGQLRAPEGTPGLMTINLEWERHYTAPVWPSEPGKHSVTTHLDIPVKDVDGGIARALAAGATMAAYQPQEHVRVMLDPDGHPFCLFQS